MARQEADMEGKDPFFYSEIGDSPSFGELFLHNGDKRKPQTPTHDILPLPPAGPPIETIEQ